MICLVTVDENNVVGHILLSRMDAPFTALGSSPLAVRPDRQRSGIGGELIRAALERAKKAGWQAVLVPGDPDYYSRFGFDAAQARDFSSPYAGPYLQVAALTGRLPVSAGAIAYAGASLG